MIVIEFEPFHAELIHVKYEQLGEMPHFIDMMESLNNTYAWSGVEDGQVIACGGMVPLHPGCGDIWALFSDDFKHHKVEALKALKLHIDNLQNQGYERLQTTVLSNYKIGKRFVEWLGFKNEGTMRKYIDGVDYDRYAKIRGE